MGQTPVVDWTKKSKYDIHDQVSSQTSKVHLGDSRRLDRWTLWTVHRNRGGEARGHLYTDQGTRQANFAERHNFCGR